MWNFGNVKYCLNQDSRPDRWSQAKAEFDRVGLSDVQRFSSIPSAQGNQSFCLSQYAMLKSFLATGEKTLLTFEDDVIFRPMGHLDNALSELPQDWDILYLGANITSMVFGMDQNPPVRYSDYLYQIRKAWTTHAVAYSRRVVDIIVRHYSVREFHMYDNWLNESILPHYKCFLVNPMICWQRPGKSDLWGQDTDYTGAFVEGDRIMKL